MIRTHEKSMKVGNSSKKLKGFHQTLGSGHSSLNNSTFF